MLSRYYSLRRPASAGSFVASNGVASNGAASNGVASSGAASTLTIPPGKTTLQQ